MATITLKGNPINTLGELPKVGEAAPEFLLTKTDLSDVGLGAFAGQKLVLNIFPSLDTPVCATSVRAFNAKASSLGNTTVLCISADLPFAAGRFCSTEGLDKVVPLSTFRSPAFGQAYGLTITNGPLKGILARAVVVVGENGTILHTELVPEIAQEPNYDAALAALK